MGSYTDTQRFYLIDLSEFVNVEQDLNYNIRLADIRVKSLVQRVKTDISSISNSDIPKDIGFKWWKRYSNSMWVYSSFSGTPEVRQDLNSQTPTWNTSGFSYETGYGSINLEKDRTAWCRDNAGFVRWRGKFGLLDGSNIPLNISTDFITVTDTSALPARSKYFFICGGDGATGQTARIFIPGIGGSNQIEFCKYEGNGSSGEKYLCLNDLWYPTNDA